MQVCLSLAVIVRIYEEFSVSVLVRMQAARIREADCFSKYA